MGVIFMMLDKKIEKIWKINPVSSILYHLPKPKEESDMGKNSRKNVPI
jgi:hypothetical protein